MPRYINADRARETATIDLIVHHIDRQPTADVAPVRHGRWEEKMDGFWKKKILICSNCESRNALCYEFNYCPNCGARMDGE